MNITFELSKGGNSEINLTEHSIKKFNPGLISENRSNLRNSKVTKDIAIIGIINAEFLASQIHEEVGDTRKLANFSVIPEFEDCYKDVNYELKDSAGKLLREGNLTDTYVVEYTEHFANDQGVGDFKITLRERSKGGTLA